MQRNYKKTLAIDIDNVIAASAESFVEISNRLFGDHITFADFNEDWQKMWSVSHEETVTRGEVLRAHKYQKDYLPVLGAVDAIHILGQKYRIVLVTSRRKLALELTREWLAKHFDYQFNEIIFADFWDDPHHSHTGHLRDKGSLYEDIKADWVIDDQLKHCIAASNKGIDSILFGNYPWNQTEELPNNISRCASWQEVLEIIT